MQSKTTGQRGYHTLGLPHGGPQDIDFVYVSALFCPAYSPTWTVISYAPNGFRYIKLLTNALQITFTAAYGQSVGSQSVNKSFVDGINHNWEKRGKQQTKYVHSSS